MLLSTRDDVLRNRKKEFTDAWDHHSDSCCTGRDLRVALESGPVGSSGIIVPAQFWASIPIPWTLPCPHELRLACLTVWDNTDARTGDPDKAMLHICLFCALRFKG